MIYENEWDDDIGGSDDFVKNEWGDWWQVVMILLLFVDCSVFGFYYFAVMVLWYYSLNCCDFEKWMR